MDEYMTIEERAKIHEKLEYDGIKEGIEFFKTFSLHERLCFSCELANKSYSKGASEQLDIDIEKSIKWLVKHGCFGCEDSVLAKAFREEMKK